MRTANQTENKLVELIDAVIASEADFHSCGGIMEHCSALGDTGIFLGSRRAGRPPECWEHFDAILNVTDQEYPETDKCYYLQMPVEEGKRDRTELERWMAVGILFVAVHCSDKRVLIHCNQGRDRSVAVAMACVVLMCELKLPLAFRSKVNKLSQKSLYQCLFGEVQPNSDTLYKYSGLSKRLVKALMGREGRNLIQEWFRQELGLPQESSTLATKETLRVALHLIQQHRNEVSPTRSTMQKLNRFFMSSGYES
jgi:tRNA A64-2'-O-ribosylphosphate transferase